MKTHLLVMYSVDPEWTSTEGPIPDYSEDMRTACNWSPGRISRGWLGDLIRPWMSKRLTTDKAKVTCRNCRRFCSP